MHTIILFLFKEFDPRKSCRKLNLSEMRKDSEQFFCLPVYRPEIEIIFLGEKSVWPPGMIIRNK